MPSVSGANPFHQLPPVTKYIIISCFFAYIAQLFVPHFFHVFALRPEYVIHKFWVWQLFTYSFLHGGLFHFLINMFALWMFGAHIESYWGSKTYAKYYAICVLGAALTQTVLAPETSVVGSSGGIYGLLLAFAFLFPDAVLYLFFVFPMKAMTAVLVIGGIALISSFDNGGDRIAHLAHLGGMVTGFLYFKLPVWGLKMRVPSMRSVFKRQPKFDVINPDEPSNDLVGEVDRILEKISSQGLDSLTEKEHQTMRDYSQRKGN